MARASRSSKKQPAFDPSELTDLIFSPAVGTGVGSHLLGNTPDFCAEPIDPVDLSIVDRSTLATVDIDYARTPKPRERSPDLEGKRLHSAASILEDLALPKDNEPSRVQPTVAKAHSTTVDTLLSATVDTEISPTVAITTMPQPADLASTSESVEYSRYRPAVDTHHNAHVHTVVTPDASTVVASNLPTVEDSTRTGLRKNLVFWITENGDLVPQGRVKRIVLAQDVINAAEESVYDTLWTAKAAQVDDRESFRVVQAGYNYLGKKTRLSKKTIQRIIAKLIDKDFIAIERPADIYQRTSTMYRVFSYKAVLERHVQRGRSHVAKIGPGFSYVWPLDRPQGAAGPYLSTVAISNRSTVLKTDLSSVPKVTTETVELLDPSTVVRETTTIIGNDVLGITSSDIHQALRQYGAVDDEIVHRLIRTCKQQAADCTAEEIVHFIQEKGALVRVRDSQIHSPIGFLLTAVPKCLSGEAFRQYRHARAQQRAAEVAYESKRQAEIDEWRREQEGRLADPEVSEEDKQFIRECLGIL